MINLVSGNVEFEALKSEVNLLLIVSGLSRWSLWLYFAPEPRDIVLSLIAPLISFLSTEFRINRNSFSHAEFISRYLTLSLRRGSVRLVSLQLGSVPIAEVKRRVFSFSQ